MKLTLIALLLVLASLLQTGCGTSLNQSNSNGSSGTVGVGSGVSFQAGSSGTGTITTPSGNGGANNFTVPTGNTTTGNNTGNTTTPPVPVSLSFTVQPISSLAGQIIVPSLMVSINDANGTVVANATNSVTLTIGNNPGNATLAGPVTVSAVNGVATFAGLSIATVGTNYTLIASATGLTSATSNPFSETAAVSAPNQLAFVIQPTSVLTATNISPPVEVAIEDANGTINPTATNSITLSLIVNPGQSTLAGTLTVAAVNGIATFPDLSVNFPGANYVLSANSTSPIVSATSFYFSVSTASAPWPRFHQNSLATSLSPYDTTNDTGALVYTFSEPSPSALNSNPVVGRDGTCYIGDLAGRLLALNVDGTLLWQFASSEGSTDTGTPALGTDGTIYWALTNDHLRATNPDGTAKWDFQAQSHGGSALGVASSPVVAGDGTIYYFSSGGTFYDLNAADGSVVWSNSLSNGDEGSTPAMAANGTIYITVQAAPFSINGYPAAPSPMLFALSPTDGSVDWQTVLSSGFLSSPAVSPLDGSIYVGTSGGLTALDSAGSIIWTATGSSAYDPPAVAADGTIYISQSTNLAAYDHSGNVSWTFEPTTGFTIPQGNSPAIGADGTIYIATDDMPTSSLYALNPDGTVKWSAVEPSQVRSSPALGATGTIYFGSEAGVVTALH